MKKIIPSLIIPTLVLFTILSVQAADYSSMTTQQLSDLRGTMFEAAKEDQEAFRTEWLNRVQTMTDEEKAEYLSSGSGRGAGNRGGVGIGDGSGRGRGNGQQGQGGNGQGNSGGSRQGQGNKN